MIKHNKKRNTGFLYETLIREVVKHTVAKDRKKRNMAIRIIKESFCKNSEMYNDLILYKTLFEVKNMPENIANKILKEVLQKRSKINKKQLFKEQSAIITAINKGLSKNTFNNFIPNYRYLASIGQYFNDDLKPKTKVLLEENILNQMAADFPSNQRNKKINNLVVESFIKRFNSSYDDGLLSEQKELLNKFIMSFVENGVEFKLALDDEIERLKIALNEYKKQRSDKESHEDAETKTKFNKVMEFVENTNKSPINKEFLVKIMKVQELVREIQ